MASNFVALFLFLQQSKRLIIYLVARNSHLMNDNNQPEENQINIELSEEIAEGIYSNLAIITHSNSEFVLDFIRLMPGVAKAKVKSRIVITPEHAKRLLAALADNVDKFESAHGDIHMTDGTPPFPMGFAGPPGLA